MFLTRRSLISSYLNLNKALISSALLNCFIDEPLRLAVDIEDEPGVFIQYIWSSQHVFVDVYNITDKWNSSEPEKSLQSHF